VHLDKIMMRKDKYETDTFSVSRIKTKKIDPSKASHRPNSPHEAPLCSLGDCEALLKGNIPYSSSRKRFPFLQYQASVHSLMVCERATGCVVHLDEIMIREDKCHAQGSGGDCEL
jgi:hypothetical protein